MLVAVNRHGTQLGLSLVEMLVGIGIGLFIVAMAGALLVHDLREHRALIVEVRLMQDLRTSIDIIGSDLRRAGYWADATAAMRQPGAAVAVNPYLALSPLAAASDAVSFRFSRDTVENNTVDSNEQFGFRLRRGSIEMLLGAGGWQAMTDNGTLTVTSFSVTPTVQDIALNGICEQRCTATAGCTPMQRVRSLNVAITAHAAANAAVVRSVRSTVHLRNDAVTGACPT